jgi:biopolymer transport protein ExbD
MTGSAFASGPTTIEIATTDDSVAYTLHDYDTRKEKKNITPGEIEEWIKETHPQRRNELVIIRPDDRTAFRIVGDMLRRLKSAGVETYAIVTSEGESEHSVIGKTDKVLSQKRDAAPALK